MNCWYNVFKFLIFVWTQKFLVLVPFFTSLSVISFPCIHMRWDTRYYIIFYNFVVLPHILYNFTIWVVIVSEDLELTRIEPWSWNQLWECLIDDEQLGFKNCWVGVHCEVTGEVVAIYSFPRLSFFRHFGSICIILIQVSREFQWV